MIVFQFPPSSRFQTFRFKQPMYPRSTGTLPSLHVYMMTTDRGANEVLARRMWMVLAKDDPKILCLACDCFEHAVHLITLGGLKSVDHLLRGFGKKYKFFSSLATASNTLRDVSKPLFETWCSVHGDQSGLSHAKKLWPKAIGGRWNSITEVEQRMRSVGGKSMLEPVLTRVLASKKNEKTRPNDTSRQNVDDISFEETKQYQQKMGIWRTRTLEYVQDAFWWVLSEVMRITQSPGTHFSVTWSNGSAAGIGHWTLGMDKGP